MKKQKGVMKRVGVKLLVAAMIMSYGVAPSMTVKASETTLKNPIIVEDFSLACEKRVTYDCIYFGSYPQAEVVASEADEITICDKIRNGNDYIVDSETYNILCDATEWDEAGDITLSDGSRYRRLSKAEAKDYYNNQFLRTQDNYYNWNENPGYHYFKYQPIKWRVLSTDGNKAFLLASIALDYQRCDETHKEIYWKDSTIRSFLNSYDASMNTSAIDYTKKGFYNVAFSEMEKMAILTTNGISDYNQQEKLNGTGIHDEDNDEENYYPSGKIFLLDAGEIFCKLPQNHFGFSNVCMVDPDETICMKSTTYAKANGCESSCDSKGYYNEVGNCKWCLSDPVLTSDMNYISGGNLMDSGEGGGFTANRLNAIVPTLTLDLSQYQPSYAGTVCNNGTIIDENGRDISLPEYYHIHYFPMYGVHSNGIVTKVATCKSEGIKSYKCGNCDLTREEITSKDPLNHIGGTEIKNAISATDTKDGYTGDTYCKGCGEKIATGKVIAAKNANENNTTSSNNNNQTTVINKELKTQTITIAKIKSYKASKLKKKKATIKLNAKTTGNGKITYSVTKYPKKAKKYISVTKKGVVTLKKGAKKGTYKITIKAAKTSEYKEAKKVVTIKVK